MKIHDLIQGSPEWLAYRAQHFNASDAPAMMGCSPYKTRAQLLREMHTGVTGAVDVATQKRFDNGHRVEALARPLAEEIIGAELYPVTGSEGRYSASFDGLTLDETTGFEHKALNGDLRAAFDAMPAPSVPARDADENCRCLPIYHRVQMEQQLLVSGAERVLFMASEWDAEGNLVEERHVYYYPDAELRAAILNGWAQFEKDLAAYVLPEAVEPAPVGKAPETLPALRIEVTGQVTASNLAEFKQTALAAIRSVNRDLSTDADFADAEKAVKWCSDVEARLAAAKEHALSQTASIDQLFKAIDDISAEARRVRLDLDKLVTARKTAVKMEIVDAAQRAYEQHEEALRKDTGGPWIVLGRPDFAGAIKGLRTVTSVQNAVDTTLAAAKIKADESARKIRESLRILAEDGAGFEFLFHDRLQLIGKAPDDLRLLVKSRIDAHQAAEAEKKRKADEAEQQRLQAEEAARAASAAQQAAVPAETLGDRLVTVIAAEKSAAGGLPVRTANAPAAADEPATLKLGDICARLGFTMTAQFVTETLRVPHRGQGSAKLYRERDFQTICFALKQHVEQARTGQLEQAAA